MNQLFGKIQIVDFILKLVYNIYIKVVNLFIMLEDYKQTYKELADLTVPDWATKNKNALIREAINYYHTNKFNGYLSAIILRYWNKLTSYAYKCKLVVTPEDVHTWLVKSIMYAIENKPWEDQSSSIYNDLNGPDKVINRYLECLRLTFYQQLNRYKRKANSLNLSLESIEEEYADLFTPTYTDDTRVLYKDMIQTYFYKKEFAKSFILDIILYDYDIKKGFNRKRLITMLRSLDHCYCREFSERYSIDIDKTEKAVKMIKNMSLHKIKNLTELILIQLKQDLRKVLF